MKRRYRPLAGKGDVAGPDGGTHAGRLRGLLTVLLALVMWAAAPHAAGAQTRADSAAVLLETAGQFAREGRADVADALYALILQRYADTPAAAAVTALRQSLAAGHTDRRGRTELEVWSTMYGLWLGVAVPLMFGTEAEEPYGAGLLIGGPAGFFGSRAFAKSRPLSEGQIRAITFGGTWGTWQGAGWALKFDPETRTVCGQPGSCQEVSEDASQENVVAAAVAGGLAGIVTGAVLSRRPITAGTASAVNYGALWGTWYGAATSFLGGVKGDDILVAGLIGGDAFLLATALLAPRWNLSRSRARIISIAGVVGGLGGAGIDLLIQSDDEKVNIVIPLAGSIAGLVIGAVTTGSFDRPAAPRTREGPGAGAGALLNVDNGEIVFDTPRLLPVLARGERAGRPVWGPAARITLLHATF